jgi:anion-transporting  ArsA/GET3 family ATPase
MPAAQQPIRLHIISGKGGTGKSTVAASLAVSLAEQGKHVLLCEVEGRQGISRLFDMAAFGDAEVQLTGSWESAAAGGHGGGTLSALHVDPEAALREYLATYFKLGPAVRALEAFGVVEFATSIAPGLRDVLLTGKVYEAARMVRRRRGARAYDAVVLDAPPTGRITRFLTANAELAGLARMGPIKSQAESVMSSLRSPQTAIHLVTLLEDMAVQETLDAVEELREAQLPVRSVVVNAARPPLLTPAQLELVREGKAQRDEIGSALGSVGLTSAPAEAATLADALLVLGAEHAERRELEDQERGVLEQLGLQLVELPAHPNGIDHDTLSEFARVLRAGGTAG